MSFDSVFHGVPTSNDGQAVPSGNATLGIDVSAGQLYYKNPQDSTQAGWQSIRVGSGAASLPITGGSPVDVGISRLGAASLAIGNGTDGDVTGSLTLANIQLGPTLLTGVAGSGATNNNALVLRGDVTRTAIIEIHNQYEDGIDIYGHGSTGGRGGAINFWRSRPTEGVPTAIKNGDLLGTFLLSGYDGSQYVQWTGQQEWVADGDWDGTHHGTSLQYWLAGPTGADQFRMLLLANGSATGGKEGLYLTPGSGSTSSYFLMSGGLLGWLSSASIAANSAVGSPDTAISRLGAASLAIGNGTAGDFSGSLKLGNTILTSAAPTVAASQVGLGSTTASTVGAAGGASALPATPSGYLIINVAGTAMKIPYYAS